MTNKKTSVGILGAGISGLSSAYIFAEHNIDITIYERADQVGGAIKSYRENEWLVEEGPNTLMVKDQQVWDLIHSLDLKSDIQQAGTEAKKRFIVKNGGPLPLPMSFKDFFTSDLLSTRAKLRLLKEPFVSPTDKEDESIADFIRRRFGKEPLDYAINPFVSGIYAGDPESLSIKHTFELLWDMEQHYGSLLKGLFRTDRNGNNTKRALISFTEGNQQLPTAIANKLGDSVKTNTEITSVSRLEEGWKVDGKMLGTPFSRSHDIILSTLPAHTLSTVFEGEVFSNLNTLPYAPLSVIALGFPAKSVGHPLDGFGMLMPEVEDQKTLGVLFSSSLFPGRAPENHVLLTCFIGGARNPELAGKPMAELQSIVCDELSELLDISESPVFSHHCYWPGTIPQYTVGYDHYLKIINDVERQYPGLFIHGNFRGGVSVPDCITSGFAAAQNILQKLEQANI